MIPLCIIMGATGSGKTVLAHALAKKIHAEIISADSMAIYRGMDIGTAKPTETELQEVTYHLVNIREPWESYNAGSFVDDASTIIEKARSQAHPVIIVGGTVLYIKRLLEGIFNGPPANWQLRDELAKRTTEDLYAQLCQVDPNAAKKIYAQDNRRIIRALEVYLDTGIPISQWQKEKTFAPSNYQAIYIGVERERSELYRRIEKRVDWMIENGLIEETKRLLELPYPLSLTASQAIGYQETIAALSDPALMPSLISDIKCHTRQFAKRQLTWLRRFHIQWFDMSQSLDTLVQKASEIWQDNTFLGF
jgi:tRNA dimethylallyltransferase